MSGKKIAIIVCAAAIVIAGIATALLLLSGGEMKKALSPGRYTDFKVTVTARNEPKYGGSDEEPDTDEGLITDEEPETTLISEMHSSGGMIYETGISGERYYFNEQGRETVIYRDDIAADGAWVKAPAEKFNIKPAFNPACLELLSSKDFKKSGGSYEPAADGLDRVFFDLLDIEPSIRSRYMPLELSVTVQGGRLHTVSAVFEFDSTVILTQTMTFSYGHPAAFSLPEASDAVLE